MPLSLSPEQVAFILSGLTSTGGCLAFATKRSIPSLIGGTVVGLAYAYTGKAILDKRPGAFAYGIGASLVLGAASWPRLIAKPSLGMVPWTLGSAAVIGLAYFTYMHLRLGADLLIAKSQ